MCISTMADAAAMCTMLMHTHFTCHHTGIICKKRFSAIFGRIIDIAAMISVICRDLGDDAAISEGIIEIIIIKHVSQISYQN